MSLPDIAIRRSVTIYIACAMVILLGAISLNRLPIDLMPDIEFPRVTVNTRYPGAAPEEVETLITRRVENAVGSAPGVEEVTSSSTEGQSRVFVSFAWGTNLDEAANELRTRLDRIRNSLPDGSDSPQLFKFDVSQFPIMMLAVSGDMEPRELRRFAEDQIQYRIERVPGVGQANVQGGLRREIHVNLSLEKLRALNLSVNEVVNLIRRENENLSAGTVEEGRMDIFLRTQGQFQDLSQIQNLVLATRQGVPVYLRDIAEVEDGVEDERQTIRVDGQLGVRMQVQKQSGANTVAVARGVRDEIARVNQDFPNIRVRSLQDSSVFIERSIFTVGEHAVLGGILAVLILLLFLRNIRSTMIVSLAIPISLIGTFALLYFSGFTLNTVTLGGLALGVGRLVDDAIVVLENVFRHREAGKSRKEAASIGTHEVSSAIIASTLTTIVVFLPIAFLSGLASVMFRQLAFTVAFALFCSLLVALTLIPVLCSKYLRVEPPSAEQHPWLRRVVQGMGSFLEGLDVKYQRSVAWALHHRKTVVVAAACAVAVTFLMVPFVGVELMPQTDEGQVNLNVELATGTRLPVSDEVVLRIEDRLRQEVPEMKSMMVQVGSGQGGPGFGGSGTNTAQVTLDIGEATQRKRSSEEIAALLNRDLNQEAGVQVRARATGGMRFQMGGGGGFGGGDRASVEIRGYNLQYASDLAKRVKDLVESVPGVTDARISRSEGLPEMLIKVDRLKAATLGLNVNELGGVLQTAIGGTESGLFRQEGDEYNIIVRLREADRSHLQNVDLIPVSTPGGKTIPIGGLITTQRQEGPIAIDRQDRERIVTVSANFFGRDLGSVMEDIQAKLDPLRAELPQDFAILYGGEYEEQQKSFRQLVFALLLAIALVYMVMAAQYESWRDPFIILFSIPLAAVGVVLTLLLTGSNFSIQAFLGVIMLSGIAVSNAILLVDYTNLLRRRDGLSVFDAVTLAGRRRLRPILMTTLTTSLGLFPMAIGFGAGAEVQAPMARVVIGGLITSTAITLLFIPTLYAIAEERTERRAAEAARRAAVGPVPEPLSPAEAD
ncbi:MAG: efflux RND transporter permease subunit [Acidobacteria bacterium]|nr:efflux RND transporter permease subunit [Acidobacteriota bacterium]